MPRLSPPTTVITLPLGVIENSSAASLELVREGKIEVRQHAAFEPLYLRSRPKAATAIEVVS